MDRFSQALGAEPRDGGTMFRVHSTAEAVQVRIWPHGGGAPLTEAMTATAAELFEAFVPNVGHGDRYAFVVDGRELPDPYARCLPEGVHAPAMVYASSHSWKHGLGVVRPLSSHVFYELHVGAFTRQGTFEGAIEKLRYLESLGVTAVELMPVSSFPRVRGWGYDGVAHFAPHASYGSPDDLRALIDEAHALGLSVFSDVVFDHFGPVGLMRRYVLENALYRLQELRFDGLCLDTTHAIFDDEEPHILTELAREVKQLSPAKLLVARDDRNEPGLVTRFGLDGIWADDFHHQLHVTLTAEKDGYYAAYEGGAAALVETLQHGWFYRGQSYPPTGLPRGRSADALSAESFVYCIQNHDQIGNRAFGARLNGMVSAAKFEAASAIFLFLPMTPVLFMGQEWAASTPFMYFTEDDETFLRSRLDWEEAHEGEHALLFALYRELLWLRRRDPVLGAARRDALAARDVGDLLIVERWNAGLRRTLLVNMSDVPVALPESCLVGKEGRTVLVASRAAVTGDCLAGWAFMILARVDQEPPNFDDVTDSYPIR